MKITSELIKRFFNKECTAEEATHVAAFLKSHPAELNKYLDVKEWNNVNLNDPVPDDFFEQAWKNIDSNKKKPAAVLWLKKAAVAAVIAGVILAGVKYYKSADTTRQVAKAIINIPTQVVARQQRTIRNTSKQTMQLALEDGSVVRLSPAAVIQYDTPFQNNKREIHLEGEAWFSVAKDKTKPFTVYAGSLTTTALGTKFKITTWKNSPGDVNIKLFTGKVVIRPVNSDLRGWKSDIYLLPGQQLKYNADKLLASVDNINNTTTINKHEVKIADEELPQPYDNNLTFNSTALPKVIDQLSKYFSTTIKFNKDEIGTMNFTGTINKSDSLSNVLQLIGRMNNLEVVRKNDTLVIQKLQQQ